MECSEFMPRLTDDPVAMAAGTHPFPFRTRQLSPPAPMVLGGRPPGRVGRRRVSFAKRGRPRPWAPSLRWPAAAVIGTVRRLRCATLLKASDLLGERPEPAPRQ